MKRALTLLIVVLAIAAARTEVEYPPNYVAATLVPSCPAGDPDAGKTIDISGSPQGHILRVSK